MKELRVRLLILFTSTGTLMTAGYCDSRPAETFVLTEAHLILRPDQVEEAPASFVAESDELEPPVEAVVSPAGGLDALAAIEAPAHVPAALEAAAEEVAVETTTEDIVIAWGPAKLGDRRRVKTYLASAEPEVVAVALPIAVVTKNPPVELKPQPTLSRGPASVPRPATSRPTYVAAARANPAAVSAKPTKVQCRFEIESPNGGEDLSQSVGERVLWKSSGVAGGVRLKLMKGEEDLGTLSVVRDDGSTLIRIPDLVEPGPGYRLRIEAAQDPSCFDESDAEFSLHP